LVDDDPISVSGSLKTNVEVEGSLPEDDAEGRHERQSHQNAPEYNQT